MAILNPDNLGEIKNNLNTGIKPFLFLKKKSIIMYVTVI